LGALFDAPSSLSGFSREELATLRDEALAAWSPPLARAYSQDLTVLRRRLADAQGAYSTHFRRVMDQTDGSRKRAAEQAAALAKLAGQTA
jgi:hypothetical protein